MALPSVTVVCDASGCHHPPGARAWWMGDVGVLIHQGGIDIDDAALQVHRALSRIEPATHVARQHLRDVEVALRCAREHLEQARRSTVPHH